MTGADYQAWFNERTKGRHAPHPDQRLHDQRPGPLSKGKPIESPKEKEEPSNVINLMEALRQSVQGGKARGGSKKRAPKAKRARRTPRKRKAV